MDKWSTQADESGLDDVALHYYAVLAAVPGGLASLTQHDCLPFNSRTFVAETGIAFPITGRVSSIPVQLCCGLSKALLLSWSVFGLGRQTMGTETGRVQAYDGKVASNIDHKAYMPAAWRVDEYLDGEDDISLADLGSHRLVFSKAPNPGDDMARDMDRDDLEVQARLCACLSDSGRLLLCPSFSSVKLLQKPWDLRTRFCKEWHFDCWFCHSGSVYVLVQGRGMVCTSVLEIWTRIVQITG
jgi:hypothetical protein